MTNDNWMEMMTTKITARGGAFGEMIDRGKFSNNGHCCMKSVCVAKNAFVWPCVEAMVTHSMHQNNIGLIAKFSCNHMLSLQSQTHMKVCE